MVKENIPTSVLMHVLICLSYLSKDKFTSVKEDCKFYDRITEFVEYYSNIRASIIYLFIFKVMKVQKLIKEQF
jgi:hypothetical protein